MIDQTIFVWQHRYWCKLFARFYSSVYWWSYPKSPSTLLCMPSWEFGPNASTIKSFQYSPLHSVLSNGYNWFVFPLWKSVEVLLYCWLSIVVYFIRVVFLFPFFFVWWNYKAVFFFIYYGSYPTTTILLHPFHPKIIPQNKTYNMQNIQIITDIISVFFHSGLTFRFKWGQKDFHSEKYFP